MYGKPEITIDGIICEECRKEFKKITSAHLQKWHGLTIPEYKEKWGYFRTQPIEAGYITKLRKMYNKKYKTFKNLTKSEFKINQFKKGHRPTNYPCEQKHLQLQAMNGSEAHTKAIQSESCRKKKSLATKRNWQRPEYRKAQVEFATNRKRIKGNKRWVKTKK